MATFTIANHSGGMNRKVSDVLSDKSEYRLLMNWNTNAVGSLTKVEGTTQLGAQIVNNASVDALYEHSYVTGGSTTRRMIATCSSTAAYYNGSAWVAATGFNPVETEVESFATIDNDLFVMSPTRGLYKSTDGGATYAAVSASPSGKYITAYRNFLWILGDPNFPNRVWKSEIGGSTAWAAQEFDNATFETVTDAGTGLNSQNDQLLIFQASGKVDRNNTSIQRTFVTNHLGVSNQAIASTDYFAFWPTNEAQYAYVGDTPQEIGKRVRDLLRAGSNTVGSAFQRTYNQFLGTITIDDVSYTNVLLTYDANNDIYYTRDDLDIKSMSQGVLSGKEYLMFGDSDGNVWYIDPDETQNKAGANSNITAVAQSNPLYMTNPKIVKRFTDVFVVSKQGEGTQMDVRIDFDKWIHLGQLQERFTMFEKLGLPQGHVLEYRLTHTGTGSRPEIEYIEFTFEPTNASRA